MFCILSKEEMKKTLSEREPGLLRTNEQMDEHLALLLGSGGDKSQAKSISYNVIENRLLDVPLNQVM